MKIIDTSASFADVYGEGGFDLEKWKIYADGIRPGLRELCFADMEEVLGAGYSWEKDFLPVLNYVNQAPEKMAQALASFRSVTDGLDEKLISRFGRSVDAELILYLGLCSGAGWVTQLEGTPVILLGIEKILELDWGGIDAMNGLVLHELGHLYQAQYGVLERELPDSADRFLWQLFTEGIAMVFEQEALGESEYFHQYGADWMNWCRANVRHAAQAFADDLGTMTRETQRWFGDWVRFEGRGDVGYYLGARLVRFMMCSRSFDELLSAGIEEVRAGFDAFRRSL